MCRPYLKAAAYQPGFRVSNRRQHGGNRPEKRLWNVVEKGPDMSRGQGWVVSAIAAFPVFKVSGSS
jgi:hypothetical protein